MEIPRLGTPPVDRAGAEEATRKALPGPPLTAAERRLAGTTAPSNAQGQKI